jgi:hypothetical protein
VTDRHRFNRRSVTALLWTSIIWPIDGFGPRLVTTKPPTPLETSLQRVLSSLYSDLHSANAVGEACLRSLPESERRSSQLSKLILTSILGNKNTIKSKEALRQLVAEQVRSDFANGAVLSVDDWLLSLTEARVFALLALS